MDNEILTEKLNLLEQRQKLMQKKMELLSEQNKELKSIVNMLKEPVEFKSPDDYICYLEDTYDIKLQNKSQFKEYLQTEDDRFRTRVEHKNRYFENEDDGSVILKI